MQVTLKTASVVKVYVPRGALLGSLGWLYTAAGGCTRYKATGFWNDSDNVRVKEPVYVLEYVVVGEVSPAVLADTGKMYLIANPAEQCFMATLTWHDGMTQVIKVTR